MLAAGTIEPGRTKLAKPDFASHGPRTPYQHMRLANLFDRHEVAHLGNSLLGEEARHEDVRVRQVELFVPHSIKIRVNVEAPTLMLVEQAGENRWRIKSRKAHEVDRCSFSYQSDRMQVTHNPIIFNWMVRHDPSETVQPNRETGSFL
jgi:hypothetical protein